MFVLFPWFDCKGISSHLVNLMNEEWFSLFPCFDSIGICTNIVDLHEDSIN